MKAISLVLFLILSLNAYSSQHYEGNYTEDSFQTIPEIYMYDTYAEAHVTNNSWRAIVCSGQIQGVTVRNNYVYAYMNNIVIQPGMYAYLYIYTNNYNPFVDVYHNIFCRYL